jgi:NTE family protein
MIVVGSAAENKGILAFLTKAPLERLISHAQVCYYPKGARICDGHQLSKAAYFLLSGSCQLRTGAHADVVESFGPGDVFGALEEVRPEDDCRSADAASDSVVLRIERSQLEVLRAEAAREGFSGDQLGQTVASLSSDSGQHPGRQQVAMLAFLSQSIPASLISEQLARSLCTETKASVLLVRLESHDNTGVQSALRLSGELQMSPRVLRTEGGYHFLPVAIGSEAPSSTGVSSLVARLRAHFEYVLIEAPMVERAAPWLIQFLMHSNLAYAFLEPAREGIDQLELIAREVRERAGRKAVQIRPIMCLGEDRLIDGFDWRAERIAGPIHMFVHGCAMRGGAGGTTVASAATGSFNADIRRLAREISGRLVGLALSSGAAKGFSHIGVIQVLEENGIQVDVVAGSSMGAYIGALWAYGIDGREMERLAREMEERWALWSLVDPVFLPRQGFLRGEALKKRLMRTIGTARFGDLLRPLRVVAGNLATLERMVFASGEVATAVHCSAAVPGICVPITIDGETYVDGSIVDPLPVGVLREMGVTKVIAVDAIPTPERIRFSIQAERELARQKQTRARGLFRRAELEQPMSEFARGNLLQIVMRSLQGSQIRVAEASCLLADLVLRPKIYEDCWLDCGKPGKFIALGREVAERHLEEIKTLIA